MSTKSRGAPTRFFEKHVELSNEHKAEKKTFDLLDCNMGGKFVKCTLINQNNDCTLSLKCATGAVHSLRAVTVPMRW